MQVIVIPSETGFGRDGCMDSVNDGTGDIQHFRNIAEETGAGTFSCHFLDGAAEVDVDKIGFSGLDDTRRIGHRFGIPTVDLNGYGSFGIVDGEFARRGGNVTHKGIGVDKLRVHPIGTETFT